MRRMRICMHLIDMLRDRCMAVPCTRGMQVVRMHRAHIHGPALLRAPPYLVGWGACSDGRRKGFGRADGGMCMRGMQAIRMRGHRLIARMHVRERLLGIVAEACDLRPPFQPYRERGERSGCSKARPRRPFAPN